MPCNVSVYFVPPIPREVMQERNQSCCWKSSLKGTFEVACASSPTFRKFLPEQKLNVKVILSLLSTPHKCSFTSRRKWKFFGDWCTPAIKVMLNGTIRNSHARASAEENLPLAIFLANRFWKACSCCISDVKPGWSPQMVSAIQVRKNQAVH